jgi:hypothetical protein
MGFSFSKPPLLATWSESLSHKTKKPLRPGQEGFPYEHPEFRRTLDRNPYRRARAHPFDLAVQQIQRGQIGLGFVRHGSLPYGSRAITAFGQMRKGGAAKVAPVWRGGHGRAMAEGRERERFAGR